MRSTIMAVALVFAVHPAASATPLLTFTDASPSSFAAALLSDTSVNWAVSWTQSVASSSVTLSAILASNVGPTSANWYVTTQVGPATTPANVVYSGTYIPPTLPAADLYDFNLASRTVLGAGLNFAPGTYFLVLDGPPGPFLNNANWVGDFNSFAIPTLASGFNIGTYYSTPSPDPFAPKGPFANSGVPYNFVFEMQTEPSSVVPEPATFLLVGGGLAGLALRRRRS